MSDNEQRKYNRLPKNYRVEFKEFKFPTTHQAYHESRVVDISAGGVCVEAKTTFSTGTKVQVRVHVPRLNKFMPGFFKYYENDADQFINAIAEVAWVEPAGGRYLMGFRFLDLDPDIVRAIQGLISDAVREAEKREALAESNRKVKEDA